MISEEPFNLAIRYAYPRHSAVFVVRGGQRVPTDLHGLRRFAPSLFALFRIAAGVDPDLRIPEVSLPDVDGVDVEDLLAAAALGSRFFMEQAGDLDAAGLRRMMSVIRLGRRLGVEGLAVAAAPTAQRFLRGGGPEVALELCSLFLAEAEADNTQATGVPKPGRCWEIADAALQVSAACADEACELRAFRDLPPHALARLLARVTRGTDLFRVVWTVDFRDSSTCELVEGPKCRTKAGHFSLWFSTHLSTSDSSLRWSAELRCEQDAAGQDVLWACELSVAGQYFRTVGSWPDDRDPQKDSSPFCTTRVTRFVPAKPNISCIEVSATTFQSVAQRRVELLGAWLLSPGSSLKERRDVTRLCQALSAKRRDGDVTGDAHRFFAPVLQAYRHALWPSDCNAVFRKCDT